jgi:hypothetical protein
VAQFRKDKHQYLPDGKTIFEVVMLSDQYGNLVGSTNPSGVAVDAFGRSRQSQPLTLFDSFHRYEENQKFSTANTAGGTYSFDANEATIDLVVDGTSGAKVQRETNRVFAYQPGKSLLIMNTFVMADPQANLAQRVGYYNDDNGVFLEQVGTTIRFGIKSKVTGTVQYEYANQADWNIDTLLGAVPSSPSQKTLDLTKAQIFWTDIEWLGVGSVRCGFVIDGQLIHCHTFHHANRIDTTYMTTACLPVRYEIENIGTESVTSTLKQICTTIISEGGYEVRGKGRSYGQEPANQRRVTTAGTYYPLISLRLKSDKLDGIVVVKDIDIAPINSAVYKYRIVANTTITGAVWTSAGSDSAVEYDANNSSTISGGVTLASGLIQATNQSAASIKLDGEIFKYQLERNGLAGTPTVLTLAITAGTSSSNVVATMDWQEFT